MKKIYIFILLSFTFLTGSLGQITTREINIKEVDRPVIYDSSSYFFEEPYMKGWDEKSIKEIKKFIGQEITIIPISKSFWTNEYFGFYHFSRDFKNDTSAFLNSLHGTSKYECHYRSDSFSNKVYKIIDGGCPNSNEIYCGADDWHLKIANNIDTLYYLSQGNIRIAEIPFIVNGYLIKSKKLYLNKTFVPSSELSTTEINTGENIILTTKEKWKCIDVTFVDMPKDWNLETHYYVPVLILKNNENKEIMVNFSKIENNVYIFDWDKFIKISSFYNEEEFKMLNYTKQQKDNLILKKKKQEDELKISNISKYGENYGKFINEKKVIIGMSEEMCEKAWGMPINKEKLTINEGTFDVYQYDYKTFLYFENGILKIIKQ